MRRLTRSLLLLLSLFLVLNLLVAALAIPAENDGGERRGWALGAIFGWHLIVASFLFLRRHDFLLLPERRPLHRVNLANVLTSGRLCAAPTVAFTLIWGQGRLGLVLATVLTALVFLTDLADGPVSRRGRQQTVIGSYLDSTTDYVLLIVISAVFVVLDFLELWFVLFLAGRLLFQALAMATMSLIHRRLVPRTSILGKASIAAAMIVYGISLLQGLTEASWAARTVRIAEIAAATIIALSVIDKAVLFVRCLRAGDCANQPGPERKAEREARQRREQAPN